jgi:hypothetical protein
MWMDGAPGAGFEGAMIGYGTNKRGGRKKEMQVSPLCSRPCSGRGRGNKGNGDTVTSCCAWLVLSFRGLSGRTECDAAADVIERLNAGCPESGR